MKDILQTLIAFPTVTGDETASLHALDYIDNFLSTRGMRVKRFNWDAHPSLLALSQPNSKKPRVLLSAHLDVMPADPSMFHLKHENGTFYGRGVWDMKNAIAAYMQIVDELQEDLQAYDFGIMITSDEELGGKDGINSVKRLIDEGYSADVVVMPDGGENWQLETFAKGYLHMTLKAHGKAAHGSRPWEGDNANIKLIDALSEIKAHFKKQSKLTETVNIGMLHGGDVVNKIPAYAQADIEMRLMSTEAGIQLAKMVKDVCATHNVEVVERAFFEPAINKLDNPHLSRFATCIEQITGVKNTGMLSYGGTDARFFTPLGIPVALVRSPGGGIHGDDEWIEEKGFYQLKDVVSLFLQAEATLIEPLAARDDSSIIS